MAGYFNVWATLLMTVTLAGQQQKGKLIIDVIFRKKPVT